jgi:urease accessory protein
VTAHFPIAPKQKLQRAHGVLNISAQQDSGGVSRLKNLRQQGSYRAIFPRTISGNVEAVIINTAGGVTGGDNFSTTAVAHENAGLSLTTQAAERIYRAPDKTAGFMKTSLSVQKDAQMYWLPQETILFDGSRLERRLDVDLHANAKFLMVEPLVFGREASGETLRSGTLDDRVCIAIDGQPIYLDRIKLDGDIASQLGAGDGKHCNGRSKRKAFARSGPLSFACLCRCEPVGRYDPCCAHFGRRQLCFAFCYCANLDPSYQ